ncbi:MAG: hypothetical protein ABI790_09585 [Betaproteobacteria bacterium]
MALPAGGNMAFKLMMIIIMPMCRRIEARNLSKAETTFLNT